MIGISLMENATFTPEQIEDAIRYGMRGDRMRYETGADESAQKRDTYLDNLAHYRSVAQRCLEVGDYRQAAEKSWGAYAQTIKATCAGYGIRVSTHANILSVAQALTALAASADADVAGRLRRGFNMARSLHQHFYENDLEHEEVGRQVGEVMSGIDLLQTLFRRG